MFNRTPHRLAIFAIVLVLSLSGKVSAGVGPENVLVVMNANSVVSREIGHRYARLRSIPDGNLVYLDWQVEGSVISLEQFRTLILKPVLRAIASRGLTSQIDCVTYSADLPYVVKFSSPNDFALKRKNPHPLSEPVASVTGLTYLWQLAREEGGLFLRLDANRYYQRPDAESGNVTSQGFRSWYGWREDGKLMETGTGSRYLLSTKLAVTSGVHVNTPEEVLYYLRRSAAADGALPAGTIYFVRNGNVRSTVRQDAFPAIVRQLQEIDVAGRILTGRLPDERKDVQGVTIGTSDFDWLASGSRILPGAICDNLTSYGGALHRRTKQTTLDVFLRYGAAGASGTVGEPLAIQAKFPTPAIHLHYARGSTLAEAFYQSVAGPYQLLIVGDPLCSPWAKIPAIGIGGIQDGQQATGSVVITPNCSSKDVDRFELFVDGHRLAKCSTGESFTLDTRHFADGWHEVRVVGIEASAIETQGRKILQILVNNHGRKVELTGLVPRSVAADETLAFTVTSTGAQRIEVFCHGQRVAEIPGSTGTVRLPARRLGRGPVVLRVVAYNSQQPYAIARPVTLFIKASGR